MARVVKINRGAKRKKPKKKKVRKVSLWGILHYVTVLVSALALLISYFSIFFDPTRFWPPMFFGLYFIPIFLLNLVLLVIGLARHSRATFVTFVILLPSLLVADKFVKIGSEDTALSGEKIKVLTYNVGRYHAGRGKMSYDEAADGIRRFIRSENADIVCLQEFMSADTADLFKLLPEYPYHADYYFKGSRYFGNVTLSRYPILDTEVIKFKNSTNLALFSDVKIGSRMVRIFNCHLESYSISFTSLIKRISKKGAFQEEFNSVHLKVKEANIRRAQQVREVLDKEASSNWPTIVCGDFNDTPISYAYHQLMSRKKDSFAEAGTGFSATYSTLWPLLRIDYILIPSEYSARKHTIYRIPFSDHYPVTTDILFEQ
ncbi:MAG: endonuclease/exonuclease/phosphatase family protein [Bacteroidales bacterium]|nr:endonuclease/exonuclease/phosphatase family protein [Candidatus Cacconaster merdequi]